MTTSDVSRLLDETAAVSVDTRLIDELIDTTDSGVFADVEDVYELSPLQEGILFHTLRDPEEAMYFQQAVFTMAKLDVSAFEQAWQHVVDRHTVLRTSFHWEGLKRPLQAVHRHVNVPFVHLDWRAYPALEQEAQLTEYLNTDRQRGLSLSEAPLLRVTLIRISEDTFYYVWSHHHILMDGWSGPLIFKELMRLYEACRRGHTLDLPESRPFLRQQDINKAEEYWRGVLEGFEMPTPLPEDRSAEGRRLYGDRFEQSQVHLSEEHTAELNRFVRSQKITLNTLIQGAWALLTASYSDLNDVCFGSLVSGRTPELQNIEQMVGLFINTLPVRVKVPQGQYLSPWLKQLHAQQVEARRYEFSPLLKIQGWSQVPRGQPLFESLVVFENYPGGKTPGSTSSRSADRIKRVRSPKERTNYPLAVLAGPGDSLLLRITYDRLRFAFEAVKRLLDQLKIILEGIATDSERPLEDLLILPVSDRQKVLVDWNDNGLEFDLTRCAHELIEDRAVRDADAEALSFRGEGISYGELDRRANRLAWYLRTLGVGPEKPVGLYLERGPEAIVGLLGILKAGGVYLPLDPAYPSERLAYIVRDAEPCVVLTQRDLGERLPRGVKVVGMDDPGQEQVLAAQPVDCLDREVGPDNAAYIIYTSGSTGEPKGVVVEHRNLVNLVLAQVPLFEVGPGSRVLQMISLSFDASLGEIFRALVSGATLCLARQEDLLPGPGLLELLRRERISVVAMPPSLLANLPDESLPDLRTLVIGGEACPPEVAARWGQGRRLINGYGPTETTIGATAAVDWDVQRKPPLGRPLANVRAYVVDVQMRPVAVGIPGELYLGGAGVARGYLNRPELTAERFVADPFAEGDSGARVYRTGDRVRWLPDGQLEFIGRVDQQVKVRGYRIELGEVEAVLSRHPKVRACAADVRGEGGSTVARLVGYVVRRGEEELTVGELREFMKECVPEYMVPSAFVTLEALPLTANGKIDRQGLPDAKPVEQSNKAEHVEPETEAEKILADIWSRLLGLESVGIHDNFFELGGDSILSIQLIARASQSGLNLKAQDIFEHQTISELAETAHSLQLAPAEQGIVTGEVPLTPIEHWFFEQEPPEPHHFNWATMMKIPPNFEPAYARDALKAVLDHHDALRLRFTRDGNEWLQRLDLPDDRDLPFNEIDLSHVDMEELKSRIESEAARFQRSLDLFNGPLIRVIWFDCGRERQGRLMIIVHHIAVDGVSWRILMEDLMGSLRNLRTGVPITLPRKTTSFKDWAEKLRQYVQSGDFSRDKEYWLDPARGNIPAFPRDFMNGRNSKDTMCFVVAELEPGISKYLSHVIAKELDASLNVILIAALVHTIQAVTGENRTLINIEGHGREEANIQVNVSRTIGWFTSFYPLLTEIIPQTSEADFVKGVAEQIKTVPDRGFSYLLLRYLGETAVRQQLARQPQAEIGFNYMGQQDEGRGGPAQGKEQGGKMTESIGPTQSREGIRPHVLDVSGIVRQGVLQMRWTYSSNLHRRETIRAAAEEYFVFLRGLAEAFKLS